MDYLKPLLWTQSGSPSTASHGWEDGDGPARATPASRGDRELLGEGGAALSRRNYGETIAHLTAPTRYPYQFAANYGKYATQVDRFPVDAHMLVALMAPRPVFLQTGDGDGWSDPRGEFLAAVAAAPVYKLFGKEGLGTDQMPEAGLSNPAHCRLSHACGRHGTLPGD
jgi:hypothetical protein